jgi:hypothetical protein
VTLSLLNRIFGIAMGIRFACVFIYPPSSHLFSDAQRHWDNAGAFLSPTLFGSVDPIMYQMYLGVLRFITHDNALVISIFTGLLSTLMPWCWYKALGDVLPELWALLGGIAIAFMPSLLMIYSYYMQETLLLTLLAAGVWLSLRAIRLGTLSAYAWAVLVWVLACFTRVQAIPVSRVRTFPLRRPSLWPPSSRALRGSVWTSRLFNASPT